MTKHIHFKPVILLIFLLIFGCSCSSRIQSSQMNSPQMRVDDVIRIANIAAQDAGFKLSRFKKPKAHFEFVEKDHTWTVFYDGKVLIPGNHFLVWVNDITGETRVMPGE